MKGLKKAADILLGIEIGLLSIILIAVFIGFPFGVKPYVVLSGSMEPTMHVGSLAYVDTGVTGDEIAPGEIVAFDIAATDGQVCTHRAIANDTENGLIQTKGDKNEFPDASLVPYTSVVGREICSIPLLGFAMTFVAVNGVAIALVVGATALLSYLFGRAAKKSAINND